MKKQITIAFAAAAMAFAAGPQTFTGIITDDMCDNGRPQGHEDGERRKVRHGVHQGHEREVCAVRCEGKKAYVLSDQKTPAKFAAKKVT